MLAASVPIQEPVHDAVTRSSKKVASLSLSSSCSYIVLLVYKKQTKLKVHPDVAVQVTILVRPTISCRQLATGLFSGLYHAYHEHAGANNSSMGGSICTILECYWRPQTLSFEPPNLRSMAQMIISYI